VQRRDKPLEGAPESVHATVACLDQLWRKEPEGRTHVAHARNAENQRLSFGSGDVMSQPTARKVKELGLNIAATIHNSKRNPH
jgi:hypothetical protein